MEDLDFLTLGVSKFASSLLIGTIVGYASQEHELPRTFTKTELRRWGTATLLSFLNDPTATLHSSYSQQLQLNPIDILGWYSGFHAGRAVYKGISYFK